jgi:hypothetical protein
MWNPDNSIVDLGITNINAAVATGINDAGHIVGFTSSGSGIVPRLYESGQVYDLRTIVNNPNGLRCFIRLPSTIRT